MFIFMKEKNIILRRKKNRDVDELAGEVTSWYSRTIISIGRGKIATWKGTFFLAFLAGSAAALVWTVTLNIESLSQAEKIGKSSLMKTIKEQGCVADGILSGYGGDISDSISLINRSRCGYLHRALETWAHPPDFVMAQEIMKKITKPNMIFGMFLAEAIDPGAKYFYVPENRYLDFSEMCQKGSEGFWGEGTCKANFSSSEYRKYLTDITQKATDIGIQSFLFGQIYFQENNFKNPQGPSIADEIRKYAARSGKRVVVGAQTNDISDEKYLKSFDFIEGGVGINSKGELESQPCFSKWWKKEGDRCWALLWNGDFPKKSNDVILHLDWSGFRDDDMSIFAQMDSETRKKTLENLYGFFRKKDMGFMMPYQAIINDSIKGCSGAQKNFYSPSEKYSCKDEKIINEIFENFSLNKAKIVGIEVPAEMVSGQKYMVSVEVKNTGESGWTKEKKYRLGSQNPQDNSYWGGRVDLFPNEKVSPGEIKKFTFEVMAPSVSGQYHFQWRMLQEGKEWFGGISDDKIIDVKNPALISDKT